MKLYKNHNPKLGCRCYRGGRHRRVARKKRRSLYIGESNCKGSLSPASSALQSPQIIYLTKIKIM